MTSSLVLFAFSFLVSSSLSENPGFAVRLTNHGLEYIRDLALDLLQNEVKQMTIPDQNGESGTFIGKVHYSISSIQIQDVSVGSLDIKLVPGTGIQVATSGFYFQMKADWRYKKSGFIPISDHGSLDFKMTVDLSITGTSKMGEDALPTASVVGCQFDVQDVDVRFHGGASWLYNLFKGSVENSIKKSMQGQVCPRITDMLNRDGQRAMEKMNLLLDIGDGMELDMRLVSSPVFDTSYLQSPQKGQFIFQGVPQSDSSPSPLDAPENLTNSMFYMFMAEAMLNSGSKAYWQSGQLELSIKQSMVPPNPIFQLDTNSIAYLLPDSTLSSKYPNMEMLLNVSVSATPKFDVCTDHVESVIPADVMAFVIQPDGNITHVFTLGLTLNTTLSLWIENLNGLLHIGLSKNITVVHGDLTLKQSNVGQFQTKEIELVLNGAIPFLLAGIENKGIPLPTTSGLTFIQPEISVVKGSIIIATNVKFELPQD